MWKRVCLAVIFPLVLAACSGPARLDGPPVEMGNFRLGHTVVVVDHPQMGPFSRTATDDELKTALEEAIKARFGPYEGDKYYHIGIKLDLYALAVPGVPIVFTPQSVFVVAANFWDDAAGKRLSEDGGHALTVFEGVSKETLISSGLTQTREQQMARLAANTAKAIQDWILENPEWVGLDATPAAAADGAEAENAN